MRKVKYLNSVASILQLYLSKLGGGFSRMHCFQGAVCTFSDCNSHCDTENSQNTFRACNRNYRGHLLFMKYFNAKLCEMCEHAMLDMTCCDLHNL